VNADPLRAAAQSSAEHMVKQLLPREGRHRAACYHESAALGQGYFRSMSTTSAVIGVFRDVLLQLLFIHELIVLQRS